jgi:hypothetical protein
LPVPLSFAYSPIVATPCLVVFPHSTTNRNGCQALRLQALATIDNCERFVVDWRV